MRCGVCTAADQMFHRRLYANGAPRSQRQPDQHYPMSLVPILRKLCSRMACAGSVRRRSVRCTRRSTRVCALPVGVDGYAKVVKNIHLTVFGLAPFATIRLCGAYVATKQMLSPDASAWVANRNTSVSVGPSRAVTKRLPRASSKGVKCIRYGVSIATHLHS